MPMYNNSKNHADVPECSRGYAKHFRHRIPSCATVLVLLYNYTCIYHALSPLALGGYYVAYETDEIYRHEHEGEAPRASCHVY